MGPTTKMREVIDVEDINTLKNQMANKSYHPESYIPTESKFQPNLISQDILIKSPMINVSSQYFVYTDGYYKRVDTDFVRKIIKDYLGDKSTVTRLREVEMAIRLDSKKLVEQLNEDRNSVNVRNGILSLEDYSVKEHSPDIFWTTQLGTSFIPDATCPAFIKFLKSSLENRQPIIEIVQEFFGYALTFDASMEKALLCTGREATGKSILCDTLRHLLGIENTSSIPLERLDREFLLAHLFGKSANICTEISSKAMVADGRFKELVSGERVTAEFKNKDAFDFRFLGKLVFSCNALPPCNDRTSAFYRRLLIVKFNKTLSEAEQDKALRWPNSKLQTELPGILNWALDGLRRLRARGYFLIPEEMDLAVKEYQQENSSVRLFIDSKCEFYECGATPVGDLYPAYKAFCEESNYRALSKINFGKELREAFPSIRQDISPDGKVRRWEGIILNNTVGNGY